MHCLKTLFSSSPQQQQVNRVAQFSSTSSTLQLHSRGLAAENIYQIDGGGDGGEYEYCPWACWPADDRREADKHWTKKQELVTSI